MGKGEKILRRGAAFVLAFAVILCNCTLGNVQAGEVSEETVAEPTEEMTEESAKEEIEEPEEEPEEETKDEIEEAAEEPEEEPEEEEPDDRDVFDLTLCQTTESGVLVTINAAAGILPEGTELRVTEVDASDYLTSVSQAVDESISTEDMKALDISFIYDGVEIEPDGEVEVTIKDDDIQNDTDILHINDEDGSAENVGSDIGELVSTSDGEIKILSDVFSIYVYYWHAGITGDDDYEPITYDSDMDIYAADANGSVNFFVEGKYAKVFTTNMHVYDKANIYQESTIYITDINGDKIYVADMGAFCDSSIKGDDSSITPSYFKMTKLEILTSDYEPDMKLYGTYYDKAGNQLGTSGIATNPNSVDSFSNYFRVCETFSVNKIS